MKQKLPLHCLKAYKSIALQFNFDRYMTITTKRMINEDQEFLDDVRVKKLPYFLQNEPVLSFNIPIKHLHTNR